MKDDLNEDFLAKLRQYGLQVTYQRLAIYRALCATKEHPSAETVYREVRKQFPMISLGTVYKTLEKFTEVGLIQKVSPASEVVRYDAFIGAHDHLICMDCQSIQDIERVMPDREIPVPSNPDFEILNHHVSFMGYCPKCKGKHPH